ncbi:hypothetical protein H696_02363 [Fonticula alba]|uniref:Actin-related protein 2/3 complex subunit 3 n=1 Tax=Fonticula alba TaxID=691883 RepID=A0A058ZBW0_FONAL|nr:hypothetical protein H696_02363 [Fonticula alba]KCV71416.1 hypothetical protein H696_02363 [Fonticula alba]|eukprot:XP_009494539.1 hypothetical protein H696_02363 [Fonticula alba]
MPAYHSSFNAVSTEAHCQVVGNFPLLPLTTSSRGPAPSNPAGQMDIVDEAISIFRANVFYRNFEFQGNADRALCWIILYISDCLNIIQKSSSKIDANKRLLTAAADANFAIPGDGNFVFGALYQKPASPSDANLLRQYMSQLRHEVGTRLVSIVYGDADVPSKWWMCFTRRKFMNKSL